MPNLYNDKKYNEVYILAEHRNQRPYVDSRQLKKQCPFCRENSGKLDEVYLEESVSDQECIRIIANKYPICDEKGPLYGFHDVVIDTMRHEKSPETFTNKQWKILFETIKKRYHMLWHNPRIHMIQVFKNNGAQAGASISHSHWQIVALEEIPVSLLEQQKYLQKEFEKDRVCRLCNTKHKQLIILESKRWVVLAPHYSKVPNETWIVPKRHCSHYGELNDDELKDLSLIIGTVLKAQIEITQNNNYNICMMGSILQNKPYSHFYISLLPRKGHFAGFELATQCYIHSIPPKDHQVEMIKKIYELEGE